MPQIIDQFGRKRCQKKRKDVDFELLYEFFQKYFFIYELWDVKDAFSTYVCYVLKGFILMVSTVIFFKSFLIKTYLKRTNNHENFGWNHIRLLRTVLNYIFDDVYTSYSVEFQNFKKQWNNSVLSLSNRNSSKTFFTDLFWIIRVCSIRNTAVPILANRKVTNGMVCQICNRILVPK